MKSLEALEGRAARICNTIGRIVEARTGEGSVLLIPVTWGLKGRHGGNRILPKTVQYGRVSNAVSPSVCRALL